MSTVLKAVQELDRGPGPLTAPEPSGGDAYRMTTWLIGSVTLGTVIAVIVVGRLAFDGTSAPPAAISVPAPVVVARQPVVAAPPPAVPAAEPVAPLPAVAAAPVAAVVRSELAMRSPTEAVVPDVAPRSRPEAAAPWGRVELPPAEPSVNVEARPRPRRRLPAEPSEMRSAAVAPPPAAIEPLEHEAPTGLGLPRVQVRAIVSGSDASGRRVVLSVGGRPSVTLHEGESSDGVDVQFITANTVYLRHRGNIFTAGMDH